MVGVEYCSNAIRRAVGCEMKIVRDGDIGEG